MSKKLIILGAGSSFDFGFPTGVQLSKDIHAAWQQPDDEYVSFFLKCLHKHNKTFQFDHRENAARNIQKIANKFYYSAADSIDDFLSKVDDKVEVDFGKLTIINMILKAEKSSMNTTNLKNLFKWEENWLRVLFREEFKFQDKDQLIKKLEDQPVAFITFNYDRSLEYFIFTAVKNYYSLSDEEAGLICSKIEIIHVYGKLGPLNWQSNNPNDVIDYGGDPNNYLHVGADRMHKFISNINVINEDRNELKDFTEKSIGMFRESDFVHILGFSFLRSNYRLLGLDGYKDAKNGVVTYGKKFFGTSLGLSKSKLHIINKRILRDRIELFDQNVYEYMHHNYF